MHWIIDIPDRIEGLAMTEDFWIYKKDGEDDIESLCAIGLDDPKKIADAYDLEWHPDLIE